MVLRIRGLELTYSTQEALESPEHEMEAPRHGREVFPIAHVRRNSPGFL